MEYSITLLRCEGLTLIPYPPGLPTAAKCCLLSCPSGPRLNPLRHQPQPCQEVHKNYLTVAKLDLGHAFENDQFDTNITDAEKHKGPANDRTNFEQKYAVSL